MIFHQIHRFKVFFRFFKVNPDRTPLLRLKMAWRRSQQVMRLEQQRQYQMQKILDQSEAKSKSEHLKGKAKDVYGKIVNKVTEDAKNLATSVNDIKQEDVKALNTSVYNFLKEHISNYYKSVQSMVEGRREVLRDSNFKFDDGQTRQDKEKKFEDKLRTLMNKLIK